MFQVLADGVPMHGHGISPYSVPTVLAPVVWDPEETDKNVNRMVAFNFFMPVERGAHVVECAGRDAADLRTAIPSPSRPSRMQC